SRRPWRSCGSCAGKPASARSSGRVTGSHIRWAGRVPRRSSTSSSEGIEMAIPRFWREIQSRYNLIGSKCGSWGKVDFPPRAVCPVCGRKSIGKMQRLQLGGKGTVVTYTVIHDAPAQFEMQKPYVMAIIEMTGGAGSSSNWINGKPGVVTIGMKV